MSAQNDYFSATNPITIDILQSINRQMIKRILFLLSIAATALALPAQDLIAVPPGMIGAVIYSGYLATGTSSRQIHYVFIQANLSEPASAPLTVWLNGGPGCSSLIGMVQQIGPFLVGDNYKLGDQLTKNEYSWNKVSNLLFLESPAIVGFSTDKDPNYPWTDKETADDALAALKDFMFVKAAEFAERKLFIAGESYAGKYIPDLATLIIDQNSKNNTKYINLQGIMVGNGVMYFADNSLQKSSAQYMFQHALISNRLQAIYYNACQRDYLSPRCKFVQYEIGLIESYLNKYNIYETCKRTPAQALRLNELLSYNRTKRQNSFTSPLRDQLGEIPDCPSDTGAIRYWNLNIPAYKVTKVNKTWSVCSRLKYSISQQGSIQQYSRILRNAAVRVWLFSGDWDDVVPFTDTEKNVDKLNKEKLGEWSSWSVGDQHAGFYQLYQNKFNVITVKGAGHMVPVAKPKASFQLFYNFINNKGVNNQIF